MLESLFGHDPSAPHAALELGASWGAYAVTSVMLALAAAWLYSRFGLDAGLRRVDRGVLWLVRTTLLALVALVLFDPVLVVSAEEPVRGHVAVLLDDSLSMRIEDVDGESRGEFVRRAFTPETGTVAAALRGRFDTRFYRFGTIVEALEADQPLTFEQARSDLSGAIERLLAGPEGGSPAAVVLVTDGGVEGGKALDSALLGLEAAGTRVHVVGVGAARLDTDLEIAAVRMPQSILRGDAVTARVTLSHRGLGGRAVDLVVESAGVVLADEAVTLVEGARQTTATLHLAFTEPGPHALTFRAAPQPGEQVLENNIARRIVHVRDDRIQVLHFEGEPRFEVKFIRRAVAGDDNIHLVSLVRTAENKYYRLGVRDAGELADGFPSDEEALFRYDVLVLGSVDAELLDDARQRMVREFVSRRGGGLVLLGGSGAFAEGGYADSTLAAVMPVVLPERTSVYRASVRVRPSATAVDDPLLALASSASGPGRWESLPALTVVNPIRTPKPGAVTLLEGQDAGGRPLVIMARHRYGRGTVTAFAVRDTWRWQMHTAGAPDDATHQRLWRLLLRAMARPAGGRLRVAVAPLEPAVGEAASIEAEVLDPRVRPLEDADVRMVVTTPWGEQEQHPLTRDSRAESVYRASFTGLEAGRYDLHVSLHEHGSVVAAADAHLDVSASGREFHSPERDATLLTRIAERTGGSVVETARAASVTERVDDTTGTRATLRRWSLRESPFVLIVLIALACFEWAYRRWRSLA